MNGRTEGLCKTYLIYPYSFNRVYSEKASLKPKMPTSRTTRTIDPEAAAFDGSVRQKKLLEMTPELQHEILKKHPPSAMYRDLISNTAIEIFALPDFPFPYGSPRFSVREKQAEYLKNYAKHFDLIPLIEFNTSVDLITKNHEDNTWDLVLCKYDVYSSGIVRILRWKETFDAVVSATGIHQDPHIPDFKDLAAWSKAFPDRAIHSKQYRRPEDYLDKVNLKLW
jgi:cation diffusion facilitator CzcD-associated flavoprotein CzcO